MIDVVSQIVHYDRACSTVVALSVNVPESCPGSFSFVLQKDTQEEAPCKEVAKAADRKVTHIYEKKQPSNTGHCITTHASGALQSASLLLFVFSTLRSGAVHIGAFTTVL